ncbi:Rv1733c family protein [Streptomyces griseosporeus]|uniref:Rv1733c family protein n=1 Tax=Streptomyces griseosporeus TaxID=1910 RepID=UPI00369F1067
MRAISGLWRWRHNPLRRGTDLAEAWVALAALVLLVVAAPLAGVLVGGLAQDALQQSVRDQHRHRHPVTATVVRALDRTAPETDPESITGRGARSRVVADWRAPDGSSHHGPVMASLKTPRPGDHFTLWTDTHGGIVARPLDPATATTHAVLAGFGTAMLAAGLVEGGRRLIVWRMVRLRYARWDQAWDRTGPDWGRTGTGS